jgi:hypothetical protein
MSIKTPVRFEDKIRSAINSEMRAVANSLVDDAMDKIATDLRKRVGEMAVSILESTYEFSTDGRTLTIRVQMAPRP